MWPENWDAALLFAAVASQWRVAAGLGGVVYLGLDYAAVEAVMRMRRYPGARRAELFEQVRLMEAAALGVRNRKRARADG